LKTSKEKRNKVFIYEKNDGKQGFVINGGALSFYSNKVKNIDGVNTSTELLTDLWLDISWDGIANEGQVKLKNGKKPEKLLRRIIELATDTKNDIILDFYLGCGTTASVAHKMERQWIGIEQLDYAENDSVNRLKNVLNGEQGGISKAVKWQGGENFVYCELAEENSKYMQLIDEAKTDEMLLELKQEILDNAVIRYEVEDEKFIKSSDEFNNLSLDDKKQVLKKILDKNHLYINYSEMEDSKYTFSDEEKAFNKSFYKGN